MTKNMTQIKRRYCLDCEWTASTENHTVKELTSLVIEHAVEHDHDIDSTTVYTTDTELGSTTSFPCEVRRN
jgi:hypothetical protein